MKGLQYYYETCMSTGDIIGKVARPYYIEIDYQDIIFIEQQRFNI